MDRLLPPFLETAFWVATWSLFIFCMIGVALAWAGWEITDASPGKAAKWVKSQRVGPIGQFLIKTVIVSAAIVISAWFVLGALNDFAIRRMQQLERTMRSVTAIGGRQFWTELERRLDGLADPRMDLPPEQKEKILLQIKVISDRWRPSLLEAAAAIDRDAKHAR